MKSDRDAKTVQATDGRPITILKPELRFDFGPKDPMAAVEGLIRERKGAPAAITIEGIAEQLYYSDWWFARLDGKQRAEYPHRDDVQRLLKNIVAKLKKKHSPFIGVCRGSKDSPPGYYWVQNSDELIASLRPYAGQAVSMISTVAQITKQDWLVPELRDKLKGLGSLKLEELRDPQISGGAAH